MSLCPTHNWFDCKTCVKKGEQFSPTKYSILINDLNKNLKKNESRLRKRALADLQVNKARALFMYVK